MMNPHIPNVPSVPFASLSPAEAAALAADPYPLLSCTAKPDASVQQRPAQYGEDGSFFDDFADGIDLSRWHLMRSRWGEGNNGVLPENVTCTAEGVVVLAAHGDWYAGDFNQGRGWRSGSVIMTRQTVGPGSFEVRMKVLPHMGACSAVWTFFNDGTRNHEIDIEVPGNTRDFHYSLFTNWLTLEDRISQHTLPPQPHNDGEWHTYRFDWHTQPLRIDYYVDGVRELSVDQYVPTVAGHFNVGVWFPWEWCGNPDFETAYMLVDWVKYTPYDEPYEPFTRPHRQQQQETGVLPPCSPLPVNNFVADGRFLDGSPAWRFSGDVSIVGTDGVRLLRLGGHNATAEQTISSVNPEAVYRLRFTAKAEKTACVQLTYLSGDDRIVGEETFSAQGSFSVQRVCLTTPPETNRIRLTLSGSGLCYFGDVFLTQPSRGDFYETDDPCPVA